LSLPLAGIRIIDLTQALAGPSCTQLLAGLGAEVIKIEKPDIGDHTRGNTPYASRKGFSYSREETKQASIAFAKRNRNKKSVTLNLKSESGRAMLLRLIEVSHILVENYAPLTMAKLGLGEDALRAANHRLIHCAITGFGSGDGIENRPAMDTILQGMSGLMAVTGFEDGPPTRTGVPIGDLVGPLYATVGILAALRRVDTTGKGELVEVALYDALASLVVVEPFDAYASMGEASRFGNVLPRLSPFGSYRALDGWVCICAPFNDTFVSLCSAMGRDDLAIDKRFSTREARVVHRDELDEIMSAWVLSRTEESTVSLLRKHDVPVGPVLSPQQVMKDPSLRKRRAVVDVDIRVPGAPPVAGPGIPIHFNSRAPELDVPAPDLGQHTAEVLKQLLGMDAAAIARLKAEGVI